MDYNNILNKLKPSSSMKLNEMANKMNEEGREIINLSIGEPQFELEQEIKDALNYSVQISYSGYTNKQGIEELRKRILEWHNIERCYDTNNIIVTPGAKYAIYISLMSILNPGDEVIIIKPYWLSYIDMVLLCGGKPVIIDCNDDFSINWDILNEKINSKTKALIINNPNNPSGNLYKKDQLVKLYNLCKRHSIYLISDEIYSTIVFDEFTSIINIMDKSFTNVILINGVSKSLACTGLRIGYIIAHHSLITNILKIHQHIATCAGSLEQKALSMLSKSVYNKISEKHKNIYLKRKKTILENIKQKHCFNNPKGTFYMLVRITDKYSNSVHASNHLMEKYGIFTVPGAYYGINDYVRISYAVSDLQLKKFINLSNNEDLF